MRRASCLIFCVCLGYIFAVFPSGEVSAASPSKKIVRIAFDTADMSSCDPGFIQGAQDNAIQDMLFNGLLRFKPGDISVIEPDLAEKYTMSKDGLEFIFYLRRGIMTHPFEGHPEGVELTSEDIVFSMQKAADPKRSTLSGPFQNFVAESIDKYTVRVKLKKRVPNPERLLVNYRDGMIVSKKGYETVGQQGFKTKPVGTGAFRLAKYFPGQKVVLAAHEKYFRGRPRLDEVEVWFMPDVNSRDFALQKGELDMIEGVREQPWVDKMKRIPNTVVDVFDPGETEVIHLNASRKPLDNIAVRQALAYATNRDELRAFIGHDVTGFLCGVVPPFLPGGITCDEVAKAGLLYRTDIEKSKELLRNAGFPNGFSMEMFISERASYRKPMENIQAQWKRIGVDLKFISVDHPTYHANTRKDMNPVVMYEGIRPSADQFFDQFYHSDAIVVKGKKPMRNFSHVTAVDHLIEAAMQEIDREKQIRFWKEAQLKLLEVLASYPLYALKFVWAHNPRLKFGYDLKSSLALYPPITELTDVAR